MIRGTGLNYCFATDSRILDGDGPLTHPLTPISHYSQDATVLTESIDAVVDIRTGSGELSREVVFRR